MQTFEEIISNIDTNDDRKIPGVEITKNRLVIYFEDNCKSPASTQFFTIINFVNPPTASNGAANLAGCMITLPNKKKFHAILIHGEREDIVSWENDIKSASEFMKFSIGYIENGSLFSVGNETISLKDCDIIFD